MKTLKKRFSLPFQLHDAERDGVSTTTFIPKKFVFEGGLSKRKGVTTQRGTVTGSQQFFKLYFDRRVEDIIALADEKTAPDYARNTLGYFRDVYLGNNEYEYRMASQMVTNLMRDLSLNYCDTYAGYSNPLDFLMELSGCNLITNQVEEAVHKDIHQPHNLIFFGALGTGKSYELNKLAVGTDDDPGCFDTANVTRVTFHSDYTYAQFVGCYKPYSEVKEPEEDEPSGKTEEDITIALCQVHSWIHI